MKQPFRTMFVLNRNECIPVFAGLLLIFIGVVVTERYGVFHQIEVCVAIGNVLRGLGVLSVFVAIGLWIARLNAWLKQEE